MRIVLHSLLVVTLLVAAGSAPRAFAQQDDQAIEEILVLGDGAMTSRLGGMGSWSVLDGEEIALIGATHINETMNRVPGVWITRGSGQEHLTAIRSAVLTGPGACGGFLYLEDSVPIRPAGFCNINNLFEVNSEQARGIEVWRGPASAVLGGNALYGAINVLTDLPEGNSITAEGGPYDYYRLEGKFSKTLGAHRFGASINGMSENGYRDDTGYDQQKASFAHATEVGDWSVFNTLNWTNLNQETGGFVFGRKAYEDSDLRKTNPNPEAYRDAWSLRVASHWTSDSWRIVPYLRTSDMEFLQHFLPGQPRERNDQTSGGVILEYDWLVNDALEIDLGAQLELMNAHLDEFQEEALTTSSPFNNAVRNQGTHYDYDVDSVMVAGYYNLTYGFTDATRLVQSLRVEYLEYDYDNNGLDGNTRDDGTECGFGGCLYNRPADRDDDFDNVAGRIGVEHDLPFGMAYAAVGSGFRPPQATELYRLQRNQDIADLDSEELLSAEIGLRGDWFDIAVFAQETDNFIFRDAAGLNVSDGETESVGVEFSAVGTWGPNTFSLVGSYARHRYAFDRDVAGGEVIEDGNMVDTAPRWLGNARWHLQATSRLSAELEMVYQDEQYINAANTAQYGGHTVFNLRSQYEIRDGLLLFGRIINLLDEDYADRADYTIFNPERFRYFPAMPRQLYLGFTLAL